jgi:phosphopantothenoylcysteine decarboxylase / phosphopantothenate---cysteine ligase
MGLRKTGAVMTLDKKRILLVIGGGIAAYKSLDLVRRLRERGARVRTILTKAGAEFITPLSAASLSGEKCFTDLFSLTDEADIGHIRLSREADLVVVAPATADLMAKMAQGFANDLASTVLVATDKRVLIAPAMNPYMWNHPATRRNLAQLAADGVASVGPNEGEMAERNEVGRGRMAEPLEIVAAIEKLLAAMPATDALKGRRMLVTSGPTREPIDPVRYISNRSSGKQGHSVARAAAAAGAEVLLVSGPVEIPDPSGVKTVHVETAAEMLSAAEAALPVDVAVCAAAVADWRVDAVANEKLKKREGRIPSLSLVENPDVLATLARHSKKRPRLVIGFAAETENLLDHARAKLKSKGCDWIVANDVSPETGVFGGAHNQVHLVTASGVESWPSLSKEAVADGLVRKIAAEFARAGGKA